MVVAAEAEAKLVAVVEGVATQDPDPSLAPNRDRKAVPSLDLDEQPRNRVPI